MDRRTLLTGGGMLLVASRLVQSVHARAVLSTVTDQDREFMQLAIKEAREADWPFGAVITIEDRVMALGRNSTKRNSDPTAHAEMTAIRTFLGGHEPDRFKEATLYASGEPCPMCMGAIIWCRIKRLVFAASIAELSTAIGQIEITAREIADKAPFTSIEIAGGVLSKEAMGLFGKEEK